MNYAGTIHISERAVSVIAAQTALQTEQVTALAANMAEGVAARLGRTNLAAGVTTDLQDNEVEISIRLIIRYGCRIPDVALQVQKAVKDAVEKMTGYAVTAVHIVVQNIDFSTSSTSPERGEVQ